ncbi:fumarylacetoacetase [bacterium]|nr:fumarylacetoacetase [bacterium]
MRFANEPARRSWIDVPLLSDFPIQNLPFGVFIPTDDVITLGSRIGDTVIDLSALHQLGYFEGIELPADVFLQDSLNEFISMGAAKCRAVRDRLAWIFDADNDELKNNEGHRKNILFPADEVQMLMPIYVQDYTDFYSSREHASNVGSMFRDPNNPLLPNWLHIPVGYHGRSSSIVVSGVDVQRPKGQILEPGSDRPIFAPSRQMDFELEMAFVTCEGKPLGQSISIDEAEEYIFGLLLFNDWSARDIQRWEYVPLGPFLGKNFASSVSPWIVTLDALEPFRCEGPVQDPPVLPYLTQTGAHHFDIELEVWIGTPTGSSTRVCRSNTRHLYWSMAQQLAHHTSNGCNVNCGDLMASGTISGPTPDSYGSMLELGWKGERPVALNDGTTRRFLEDGDLVEMRAWGEKNGVRIGFGSVRSRLLPASEIV